ncbi:MAG: DUF4856 domain-containing protein, partial [Flavobacteriales bacterium]|nr:DUF4856 domain-containing protein [Flavobacteriales bacterium]
MRKLILSILSIALLASCEDKDENENVSEGYKVPTTYNFKNVSYSGQKDRLNMLKELTSYIKTGHKEDSVLNAQSMKDMFGNSNTPFTSAELNASTKQLQNKTVPTEADLYVNLFDSIAKYSGKSGGKNGQAGLVSGANRTILVDANGMEYAQLIDKGIMGSCFYYSATSSYLSDEKIGDAVDNTIVEDGKGTKKEHHFDEAFGYFGAAIDFPTNTEGVSFWAKYCNKMDEVAGTNKIMDYFLKGRAAISNKDKSDQNDAVADIKIQWEKISAATAIHYLNDADNVFTDDADR